MRSQIICQRPKLCTLDIGTTSGSPIPPPLSPPPGEKELDSKGEGKRYRPVVIAVTSSGTTGKRRQKVGQEKQPQACQVPKKTGTTKGVRINGTYGTMN
jgi:hypothetical protein